MYWSKVTMIIAGKVNYDRANIQNGIYIAYKGMVGEDISMFTESYSIRNIVNNKELIEDLR
ncbi:hypothetical protein IZY60_13945 [Lutibacter sp. B2]|nr:hypothetical protein [Lutibacter sp. B2]